MLNSKQTGQYFEIRPMECSREQLKPQHWMILDVAA